MRDDLRVADLIPTTSPYADALFIFSDVLDTGGTSGTGIIDDDIVDWVYLELRDASTNTTIIDERSALLQRDGDVVGADGVSPVTFNQDPGDYFIVVKHRNHLGIMTANTFALSSTNTVIDLTDANNQITFGGNAQTTFGMPKGVLGMWAGEASGSGQIKFIGGSSSTDAIKDYILADSGNILNFLTYASTGYLDVDLDMNGVGKFSGGNDDSNVIKDNVLAHPGNILNFLTIPYLPMCHQKIIKKLNLLIVIYNKYLELMKTYYNRLLFFFITSIAFGQGYEFWYREYKRL